MPDAVVCEARKASSSSSDLPPACRRQEQSGVVRGKARHRYTPHAVRTPCSEISWTQQPLLSPACVVLTSPLTTHKLTRSRTCSTILSPLASACSSSGHKRHGREDYGECLCLPRTQVSSPVHERRTKVAHAGWNVPVCKFAFFVWTVNRNNAQKRASAFSRSCTTQSATGQQGHAAPTPCKARWTVSSSRCVAPRQRSLSCFPFCRPLPAPAHSHCTHTHTSFHWSTHPPRRAAGPPLSLRSTGR
jgi:hypothetical protein